MKSIIIVVATVLILYFVFFTKKENFTNTDTFLAKNIKIFLDKNYKVDYKNYLDYIKLIGNTYNELIMFDNFNTLKTLSKLKMLKISDITKFMTT